MDEANLSVALLSASFAALGSFAANWCLQHSRLKAKKSAVTIALVQEVKAIRDIAIQRGYHSHINEVIEHLKNQTPGTKHSMGAKIPSHYSRIYQSLTHEIGNVDAELAGQIVRFHQLTDAVVQDLVSGGALSQGATIESYKNASDIFKAALNTADDIINQKAT